MSLLLSSYAQPKEGLTRFLKAESPCYITGVDDNDNDIVVLFPFTCKNGVLDISYSDNNFKTVMVDNLNRGPNDETSVAYKIMGTSRLVTSLGDNFKAYIRSWRDGTIDAGSPIEVYTPCQMVRVIEADHNNVNANNSDSFLISTKPPASDNYNTGTFTNNYQATFIFKTPLTFTIKVSGVTNYITFRTIMDQE